MSSSNKNTWRKLPTGRWIEGDDNSNVNVKENWFSQFQENEHLRLQCVEVTDQEGMKSVIPSSYIVESNSEESIDHSELNDNCYIQTKDIDIGNILERLNVIESNEFELEKSNKKLYSRLQKAEFNITEHLNYITFLEQEVSRLDQYGRRENIEILGIPTRINDKQLEKEVLKILHKIGLDHLCHYSIVGCHRIGKKDRFGCRPTIVRFLHRKDANNCIKMSKFLYRCKELGFNYLSIVENLCPYNKLLLDDLKELKEKGRIAQYWTTNGIIKYKETDNEGEIPKKVYHDSELNNLFIDINVT